MKENLNLFLKQKYLNDKTEAKQKRDMMERTQKIKE